MQKVFLFLFTMLIILISCGKKEPAVKFEKGTSEYVLAEKLAEKVPGMNPEENKILVSTDKFDVSTAEVLSEIKLNLGKRTEQLAQLDDQQIEKIIEENAKNLGEKKLLYGVAINSGQKISNAQVDSVMELQFKKAGGRDRFFQFISDEGITTTQIKKEIKTGLTIQKYVENKLEEMSEVSEDDIVAAYQQDKTATVRHILLKTQGKSDAEKEEIRKKMEEIREKALSGEDFAKLATEYTEDEGSKKTGGLYENFTRGKMVKPFEEAAFNVPPGEISDVIETQYGYHIIKVIERNKETKPLEEVHDSLERQLKNARRQNAYTELLDSLKTEVNFTIHEL